jgi:hypothetical protein
MGEKSEDFGKRPPADIGSMTSVKVDNLPDRIRGDDLRDAFTK